MHEMPVMTNKIDFESTDYILFALWRESFIKPVLLRQSSAYK